MAWVCYRTQVGDMSFFRFVLCCFVDSFVLSICLVELFRGLCKVDFRRRRIIIVAAVAAVVESVLYLGGGGLR